MTTVTRNRRAPLIALVAAAAVGLATILAIPSGTMASWTVQQNLAGQDITVGAVDFTVNSFGTTYTVPTPVLESLGAGNPESTAVLVSGHADGNLGLRYEVLNPTITDGDNGLSSVLHATVHVAASEAECGIGGELLFDGPFEDVVTGVRELVLPEPTTVDGGEYLCFGFSLPAGYTTHISTATVTANAPDAGVTVTDTSEWHTRIAPPASSTNAVITFDFVPDSFRPGT